LSTGARFGAGSQLLGNSRNAGPSCLRTTSQRPVSRARRRPTGSRPGGPRSGARRWPRQRSTCSALGQLARLPEDDDRRRLELDLQIALGHALIAAKGYGVPEVGEAFAPASRLAIAAADPVRQVSMLSGIGAYHYLRSESRAGLRALSRESSRRAKLAGSGALMPLPLPPSIAPLPPP
jgi:hypothetical protein